MTNEKKSHRLIFTLPVETFEKFKAMTKARETTMKNVLIALIESYVNADAENEAESQRRELETLKTRCDDLTEKQAAFDGLNVEITILNKRLKELEDKVSSLDSLFVKLLGAELQDKKEPKPE